MWHFVVAITIFLCAFSKTNYCEGDIYSGEHLWSYMDLTNRWISHNLMFVKSSFIWAVNWFETAWNLGKSFLLGKEKFFKRLENSHDILKG